MGEIASEAYSGDGGINNFEEVYNLTRRIVVRKVEKHS